LRCILSDGPRSSNVDCRFRTSTIALHTSHAGSCQDFVRLPVIISPIRPRVNTSRPKMSSFGRVLHCGGIDVDAILNWRRGRIIRNGMLNFDKSFLRPAGLSKLRTVVETFRLMAVTNINLTQIFDISSQSPSSAMALRSKKAAPFVIGRKPNFSYSS
jgi:hypothetical protein